MDHLNLAKSDNSEIRASLKELLVFLQSEHKCNSTEQFVKVNSSKAKHWPADIKLSADELLFYEGELHALKLFRSFYKRKSVFQQHIRSKEIKDLLTLLVTQRFNSSQWQLSVPYASLREVLAVIRLLVRDRTLLNLFISLNGLLGLAECMKRSVDCYLQTSTGQLTDIIKDLLYILEKLTSGRDESVCREICRADVHRALVLLLSASDLSLVHGALTLLHSLTHCVEARREISQLNCVETPIDILRGYDVLSKRLSAKFLSAVLGVREVREMFKIFDGVPLLLSLLHCADGELLWHTVWCLVHVASDQEISAEIRENGGILLLLSILRDHSLTLSSSLSSVKQHTTHSTVKSDEMSEIQSACCTCLTELIVNDTNAHQVVLNNGIYILAQFLAPRRELVISESLVACESLVVPDVKYPSIEQTTIIASASSSANTSCYIQTTSHIKHTSHTFTTNSGEAISNIKSISSSNTTCGAETSKTSKSSCNEEGRGSERGIEKQSSSDKNIRALVNLQACALRALRFLFSMERNRRHFKRLFPPEVFEKFIDLGHYNRDIKAYISIINIINELPTDRKEEMQENIELCNQTREHTQQIRDYSIIEVLGAGAFGTVYKVQKKKKTQGESYYAMKEINITQVAPSWCKTVREREKSAGSVMNELKIMEEQLRHPNVVRYYRSFTEFDRLYIVMELIEGATLGEHFTSLKEKNERFTEERIWDIFFQLILALRYLHKEKHIVHRDLTPNNIMLSDQRKVVITDFGLARQKSKDCSKMNSVVGTILYSCPEIVQSLPYNDKADIWAIGCVLYQMCTLTPPFYSSNMLTLAIKIVEGQYDPLPESVSAKLVSTVQLCLQPNPDLRSDIIGVASHVADVLLTRFDSTCRQAAHLEKKLEREKSRRYTNQRSSELSDSRLDSAHSRLGSANSRLGSVCSTCSASPYDLQPEYYREGTNTVDFQSSSQDRAASAGGNVDSGFAAESLYSFRGRKNYNMISGSDSPLTPCPLSQRSGSCVHQSPDITELNQHTTVCGTLSSVTNTPSQHPALLLLPQQQQQQAPCDLHAPCELVHASSDPSGSVTDVSPGDLPNSVFEVRDHQEKVKDSSGAPKMRQKVDQEHAVAARPRSFTCQSTRRWVEPRDQGSARVPATLRTRSNSADRLSTASSATVSISPNRVRLIDDPMLSILQQLHSMIFICQLPPSLVFNPRRRVVENFKRALFSSESTVLSLKNHLSKLVTSSKELIDINLGLGYLSSQGLTSSDDWEELTNSKTASTARQGERLMEELASVDLTVGVTYEQMRSFIESLLADNDGINL